MVPSCFDLEISGGSGSGGKGEVVCLNMVLGMLSVLAEELEV